VHHIAFAPGTAYGEAALVPAFALDVLVLGMDTYALAPAVADNSCSEFQPPQTKHFPCLSVPST